MNRVLVVLIAITALTACNGRAVVGGRPDGSISTPDAAAQTDAGNTDASAQTDASIQDGGNDASRSDASALLDGAFADGSLDATFDAAPPDAAMDAAPPDASTTTPTLCLTDSDCAFGEEWCQGGECVRCDNGGGGGLCPSVCSRGRVRYTRNGCTPCECVNYNRCTTDSDCAEIDPTSPTCYAGAVCPDWCPPGDPSCCFGGNRCGAAGCEGTSLPTGCIVTGCPYGSTCSSEAGTCTPSECFCDPDFGFVCTADCGGGSCVAAL